LTENDTFGVHEMHIAKRAKRANFFIIFLFFVKFRTAKVVEIVGTKQLFVGKKGRFVEIIFI
jgi:hypothetical protein